MTGGTGSDAGGSLLVAWKEGRGPTAWALKGRSSPVPGRWPYGLDRLSEADDVSALHTVELAEPAGVDKVRSLLPGMLRRRRARATEPHVALAWDELTGSRLVTTSRSRVLIIGVICATDRPETAGRRVREALMAADGLFCLSAAQVDPLRRWLGAKAPPVHVVSFGVDTEFYAPRPYPRLPMVLSVGNDRDRDLVTTVTALQAVRRARPDSRCVLVSARYPSHPVPEEVELWVGLTHVQVAELLGRASVVALATRPNLHVSGLTVMLEAMSTGRPVVMSHSPGAEDYLVPGTGTFVPQGDADALTVGLLAYLDDPHEAAATGIRGRRHVEASHTTAVLCRSLLDVVRQVVG